MPTFNTLFVGKVEQNFSSLPSTNDYATELLSKTKPIEGTVISTDFQTAGRGQIGSSWHADAGDNVLMSIILYPTWLAANQQFYLSMAVALAVSDSLARFCQIEASVKWPNDIYVGDKKIAGILIQNHLAGTQLKSTVIGIGVNINQSTFPEGLPNPISLKILQKKTSDISLFKSCLFAMVEQRYLQLKNNPLNIKKDYLERMYRFGEWHQFQTNHGHFFEGKITGVQPSGKLEVAFRLGRTQIFDIKEIRFITV